MAINDAMKRLAFYYCIVEKDFESMKKYYAMAINLGNEGALKQLEDYWGDNKVMVFKVLNEVDKACSWYFFTAILKKLENDPSIVLYNNKVCLFQRLQNFKQCAICLK